jgi:biotin carboxylase
MPYIWDELGTMDVRATIVHPPNQAVPADVPFPHDDLALDLSGDPEAALRVLEELHLRERYDAVFTASELVVVFCAQLAKKLGLRGIEPRSAVLARDKALMRAAFREAGLNTPTLTLEANADGTLPPNMRFPVVAKPISGFGSQGVVRANDQDELRAALATIGEVNRDFLDKMTDAKVGCVSGVLVEEYIEGKEYAVDCFVQDGQVYVMCTCEKPDLVGPYFEERSYISPARLSGEIMQRMLEEAAAGTLALGITNGVSHAELRVRDGVPYLIEIGARIGGTGLGQFFTQVTSGVPFVKLVIDNLLGGADVSGLPFAPTPHGAGAAYIVQVGQGGTLVEIEGLDFARAHPDVVHVAQFLAPGTYVPAVPKFTFYPGFIVSRHRSVEEAYAFHDLLDQNVRVRYADAGQPV